MTASLNKVTLMGNLGRDPEVRATASGMKVVTLNLATTDRWKDKNGQKQERTEWHKVVIFNDGLAGVAEKYLNKGSSIYVEGSLQTRKWTDAGGSDRFSTEIVVGVNGTLKMLNGAPKTGDKSYEPTASDVDDEIPY